MAAAYGYLFITFAALVSILGDFFIKRAADRDGGFSDPDFIIGAAAYGSAAFGWLLAMKSIRLAEAGIAYAMVTMLAAVAMGALIFNEHLAARDALGIALALGALILLGRFA